MKITLQIKLLFFSTFPHTCRVENRSFSLSPVILSLNSRPKMCFAAFLLLLLQFRFWDSGFICDHGLIPSRKIEMFCDTKKSEVWQIRLAKSFLKPSQIIPWCEHAFRNRRKLVRETGRVCFQVSSRFKIVWTWQYIWRANRFSANLKWKPFFQTSRFCSHFLPRAKRREIIGQPFFTIFQALICKSNNCYPHIRRPSVTAICPQTWLKTLWC